MDSRNVRGLPKCKPGFYFSPTPPRNVLSDRGWCYSCSPGTYTDTRNRDAQCQNCTVCSAEQSLIEIEPCRVDADTRCHCHDNNVRKQGKCQMSTELPAGVAVANTVTKRGLDAIKHATYTLNSDLPYQMKDGWRLQTARDFGESSTAAVSADDISFYIGNVAVTPAIAAMAAISTASLVALVTVAAVLCAKCRHKTNKATEVSLESDYHIYEEPEPFLPTLPSSVCTDACAEARAASSRPKQNPQCLSSPKTSVRSSAPLFDFKILVSDKSPPLCNIESHRFSAREKDFVLNSQAAQHALESHEVMTLNTQVEHEEYGSTFYNDLERNEPASNSRTGGQGAILTGSNDVLSSSATRPNEVGRGRLFERSNVVSLGSARAGLVDGGYIYSCTSVRHQPLAGSYNAVG